jgi:methionyl-tRNA formyltransferase
MNWSLIQNKDRFYTHLFRYRPGVDDGDIVAVQIFDITPFDTCLTLHYKNTLSMIRLAAAALPPLLAGTAAFTPQPAQPASYYPKRTAEDGLIYWSDKTADIYNLIRAVTRPFPGAFSYLDNDPGRPVKFWRAIPFDTRLTWPDLPPGAVIRTGDGTLLVEEYEPGPLTDADVGRVFGDLGAPRKAWENLPA